MRLGNSNIYLKSNKIGRVQANAHIIAMPEISGIELAQMLKEKHPEKKMVLMSVFFS